MTFSFILFKLKSMMVNIALTANASWTSNTSMSFNVNPVLSNKAAVEYVGLKSKTTN